MSMSPSLRDGAAIGDRRLSSPSLSQHRSPAPSSQIKVLFFTPSLGNGGAEMHLLRVMNALDREGFMPTVAVARQGGSYESALAEDITLYDLHPAAIRSSTCRMIRVIQPLRILIKTLQPDIVCSFQAHANLAAIRACQGLASRPQLIVCAQNSPFGRFGRAWHPLDRLMLSAMARMYPQADRIVALSRGVAAEVRSLLAAAPVEQQPPIDLVYNAGVDDAVIQKAHQGIGLRDRRTNSPVLVACGRLHPQKGYGYLLDALAQIRQQVPAQLWILGEGPLRPDIEQKIRALGLTDAVQLLGFQDNPYQYMAAADVFVLSSLYEGFGNVLAEAMACGVPVVATDCPHGPSEVLAGGQYGLLARPAHAEDLAQKLLQLLQNPQLREKLARRGLERSQHFHANHIARAYAAVFRRTLAAPVRPELGSG